MKKKELKKFHVLNFEFCSKKKIEYDILPYFREEWNSKKCCFEKDKVKTKNDLKEWILRASSYRFWSRCEYEFLMAEWPFGSKRLNEEMQEFISSNPDLQTIDDRLKLDNIIIRDMYKIDIHEQIEMNIDVITDILSEEFNILNGCSVCQGKC
jgi:hypothetical protein